MDQFLLSICVPTYNGSRSIRECLNAIFEARRGFESLVEVIVSDNSSNDGTFEIVQQFNEINYRFYRNESNIGFNKNLFKLIDDYAEGTFVWTIGDDDLIARQSVKFFLKYAPCMDALLMKNGFLEHGTEMVLSKERNLYAKKTSYYEAVDTVANGSNLLATFMTCAIFRKKPINAIDKTNIKDSDWSEYSKIFPNGYMLDLAFRESHCVFCSDDIFIYSVPIERNWRDKMAYLQTEILPQFYLDICSDKRAKKCLKRTKMLLIKALVKCMITLDECKYKKSAFNSILRILMKG